MRWNRTIRTNLWGLLPLVLFLHDGRDGGEGPLPVPPAAEYQPIIGRRPSPASRDARLIVESPSRHSPSAFDFPESPEASGRLDPPSSPAPESDIVLPSPPAPPPVLAAESIPAPDPRSRQEGEIISGPDGFTVAFPESPKELNPVPAPLPEPRGARLSSRPKKEDSRLPAAIQIRPIIRIHPSSRTVQVGETLTVEVTLEGGDGVQSIPFHLRYPDELLEYLQGEIGTFLGTNSDENLFMAGGPPGELFIALTRLPGAETVSGSGSLCRLRFRVIAPGSALLAFEDAHLLGPGLSAIEAEFLPASVDLLPPGPDPTPALAVSPLVTVGLPR